MNPASAPLRVAVIGAGEMGARHARVATQSQDAKLVCVVDPDARRAAAVAERYRTDAHSDLDDLRGIDAMIVAAPTHVHVEWGIRAIEAGIPVLVEKPLAEDYAGSEALVKAADQRGVPLTCGLLERFNPAVMTAFDIATDPVHITTVRHSPYPPRIRTGVAHDLLIHDVDLVLKLTARLPDRITATFSYCHPDSDPGAEDTADVAMQFSDSPVATLSVSRVSHRKVRSIAITELDRLIEIDAIRQDVTVYRHVANAALGDGPGYRQQTTIEIPTIRDPREPLAAQFEHFLRLARGEADASVELASLLPAHALVAEVERVASARVEDSP